MVINRHDVVLNGFYNYFTPKKNLKKIKKFYFFLGSTYDGPFPPSQHAPFSSLCDEEIFFYDFVLNSTTAFFYVSQIWLKDKRRRKKERFLFILFSRPTLFLILATTIHLIKILFCFSSIKSTFFHKYLFKSISNFSWHFI